MIGIYKITSPTGRVYIGQSDNIPRRFKVYKRLDCKTQPKLYNSFKKYDVSKHKFEIITECSISELNNLERYYQELYNTVKKGLNCMYQASDVRRRVLSDCVKKRIGDKHRGKVVSKETRKKQSEARKLMIGIKNPKAIRVKSCNIVTKEVLIMAVYETARYFNVDWEFIYNRCRYEYISKRKLIDWDFELLDSPIKKELNIGQNKLILDNETGFFYYGYRDFSEVNNMKYYIIKDFLKENKRYILA